MIGMVVQIYCHADFNGRRIVDVLRHIALGEPRAVSRLQDAQVFPALEKLLRDHQRELSLKNGLLKAICAVEMHRLHRNNFVHWVAGRVKGEAAIVMFSMNSKEAERRDGTALEPHEAKYAIISTEGFAAEVDNLKGHSDYLGRIAEQLEQRQDALRAQTDDRRVTR